MVTVLAAKTLTEVRQFNLVNTVFGEGEKVSFIQITPNSCFRTLKLALIEKKHLSVSIF
jgi:hypothetical protein